MKNRLLECKYIPIAIFIFTCRIIKLKQETTRSESGNLIQNDASGHELHQVLLWHHVF